MMKIVRADEVSGAELDRFIADGKPQGETFRDKMKEDGLGIAELTLAAVGDSGGIRGYISCCEASFKSERAAFIGELYAAEETDAAALVAEAEKRAAELGFSIIAVYDGSDFPKRAFGFEYCSAAGIFPPVLKGKWMMWVKRLAGQEGEIGFISLPWASVPEPDFEFDSRFTEEESRDAIYKTRRRQRIGEDIAVGLIIAVCIALMIFKHSFSCLGVAGAAGFFLVTNIIKPIKNTEKYVAEKVKAHGTCADDDHLLFFPEVFIVYDRIGRRVSTFGYDTQQFIYLKKDFLFVCNFRITGAFMSYKEMPDKDRFITYLREKCRGVRVRK